MNTAFSLTATVMRLQSRFMAKGAICAAEGTDPCKDTNLLAGRFGRDPRTWAVGFGSVTNATGESIRRTRVSGLKRRC